MTSLTDARDILRGVAATLFGFGGRLVARAILMIFAGRAFGIEALGHLGQVAAIAEITAAVCVMGLKRSLLDMLSFEAEAGRAPERRMMEALSLSVVLGSVFGGLLCFVWWQLFPNNHEVAPFLFFAVLATVLTDVVLTAIKFKRVIRWDVWARCIVEPWVFLCLAGVLWMVGLTGFGLIIAYTGSVIAAAICALIGLGKVIGLRSLLAAKPNFRNWPHIVQKSLPVGMTDIGVMSIRRLDLIVLSLFVGPEGVGLFYMAQQLVTIPHKIGGLFEPMLSPVMAKLHNRKQAIRIRENLMGVCRWVFTCQLALTIPMIVFSDVLMSIFGPEFTAGALVLSVILTAELVDGSFLAVETPLVYARPKIPPTLLVIALSIEVVSISALSYVWGVEGAALGFFITMTCLTMGRLVMLKSALKISVLSRAYFIPVGAGLCMAAALVAVRHLDPMPSVMSGISIAVSLLAFGLIIRAFALSRSDKVLIRALTRRNKRAVLS